MTISQATTATVKSWRDDPEKAIEWISMSVTFFFLAWLGARAVVYAATDVVSMFSHLPITGQCVVSIPFRKLIGVFPMFSCSLTNLPRCAVCKKTEHQVRYLISGSDINICSECIGKFSKQIEDRRLLRLRRTMMERLQQPLPSDNIHQRNCRESSY